MITTVIWRVIPASAKTYVSNCSRREPRSSLTIRPRLSVVQGSACTVVKSDGKDVADKTEDAATTAADATKDAATTAADATKDAATTAADATTDAATTAADATKDAADKAAGEATAIASGVTAAVSSASFATGASAVFGAAMVLMA